MRKIDIIRRPLITEKGAGAENVGNKYIFAVDMRATKTDVKRAVEELFNVEVTGVRTMIQPGKYKRVGKNTGKAADWKKAVVTLKEGSRIEILEGA